MRSRTILIFGGKSQGIRNGLKTSKMALEIDLQQFFTDLPSQLQQARRQLFGGNLNALEFWTGRLNDFLNVLNVLHQRSEEVAAHFELIERFGELKGEIQVLRDRFDDTITSDVEYLNELNNMGVDCPNENAEGMGQVGRPRKDVPKDELQRLFNIYHSWKHVASQIGISERTLYRHRQELGLVTSCRNGPSNTYSSITDDESCSLVQDILNVLPNSGESYIIGESYTGQEVLTYNGTTKILHPPTIYEICRSLCRSLSTVT